MFECEYSREPVDYRLLWLRFIRKIWLFLACAILGALLAASIHSIKRLVLSGGRSYMAETLYYVDYNWENDNLIMAPYNYYTWGEIGQSDVIIDALADKMGERVTKDMLRDAIALSCDSDVRYVYARITTHDKQLSIDVAKALEPVIIDYALGKREFCDAYVITEGTSAKDVTNYRIKNAVILGALIGLVASIVIWLMYFMIDTSIYVPSTIEKRYHIPTLTAPSMKEFDTNCKALLPKNSLVGLYAIEGDAILASELSKYVTVESLNDDMLLKWSQEKTEGVVIELKAAYKNGKKLERALEEFARLSIKVYAIVLVNEDNRLINSYYRR